MTSISETNLASIGDDHHDSTYSSLVSESKSSSGTVQVTVLSNLNDGLVTVQLRLGEGETSDGIIKDVEFPFNIGKDNFAVSFFPFWENVSFIITTKKIY